MKAHWNNAVLAESDDTIVLERNHYFPPDAVHKQHFRPSPTHTLCPWKGKAQYYDIVVEGQVNKDAAWCYPEPKKEAAQITGHIAFWKGVRVE